MQASISIVALMFAGFIARANLIGTEYQNFSPSISGLDFTTVHSSETLKPCMCNLGVFVNYAKNTLTYSDKYYQTNTDLKGKRVNDFLIGADVNLAIGISKNWDIGIALPFTVTAKNDDPFGVTYFDKWGLTEVRPMTKFRFYGDDDGGMAVVVAANFNTIDNNPFSGERPGATLNAELVGDTNWKNYKLGANFGYRKRNPGTQITDPVTGNPAPFVPFKDSFIFSVAGARYFQSLRSDLILELMGSRTGKLNEDDSVRKSQQALEVNLGFRHDGSKKWNIHGGAGTKLADAQSSPDVRAYAGLNYQFGPVVCDPNSKPIAVRKEVPSPLQQVAGPLGYNTAVVYNHPSGVSKAVDLKMPVSAVDKNDYQAYRWKMGPSPETDCTSEFGYSDPVPGLRPIVTSVGEIPDGGVTLCAVARNNRGDWQPFSDPTIVKWTKKLGYELFRINASVLFDFDQDTLQPRAYGELEKIAKHLRQRPFAKVMIEGHTDSKGSDAYNLDLSKRRALRVKNHLIDTFEFNPKLFESFGKGEKFPVDTNNTDEGRSHNRRVEFKIYRP